MVFRRILLLILTCAMVSAQTPTSAPAKFNLTIDNIMRGPGLVGYEPDNVRWAGDNQHIYFKWKQPSDPILRPRDTYVVKRDGSGLRKLSDDEAKLAPPPAANTTRDRKRAVYAQDGDIYLYDYRTDSARQLTKTIEKEENPRFTQDEKRVAFTRSNNLFVLSLENGAIEQLTNIVTTPPPDTKLTESQEFLKKQERALLDVVNQRATLKEEEEARKKKENPRPPFEIQPGQTLVELNLCPDETCVIAVISEGGKGSITANVPNYITETGFPEEIPGRNKVGDNQDRQKLAILDAGGAPVKWVESGAKTPDGKDRDVEMMAPVWNEKGTKAAFLQRAMDNKDRWVMALDAKTGKTRVLFTDHDDAWIQSPLDYTLGWLKKTDEVYFVSERDGYAHLYKASHTGVEEAPDAGQAAQNEVKQLTSGRFEVTNVALSGDGSRFFLTTSEGSPYERHLYAMSVDGGVRTRITREPGKHEAVLSPDEKWIADVFSYTNRPPELYALESRPANGNGGGKKLTSSPAPEFWNYAWQDVPVVEIPARDGAKVPARIYKPASFPRGGPAVIFVHGAGYLQNVHHWWSQYSPNYLFHHFLMEHGYLVLDLDYRGSSGYGRDWRTAIYRHMGGKDLDDQVDAAKWLVSEHGVDAKRIGIYGGSYGGFLTLMAMFTTPDVFAAGAALRPVTDWSHYNHGYTSNILNTPQKDPEAYRISSPINFAEGLKGALLICHGMVDTNVFFQDTVRLTQKLIELRKENWSVAFYPAEDHGFVQPTSWADEYKRVFQLFEANLKR
jgi:dipeptidyl aminopeptidase/acylaminoacyl peptidase